MFNQVKNLSSREKIFVAMSGGVDSSLSAALLKKAGYNVTGVFIKVWYPDFLECSWKKEKRDAMRVCAELEVPFLTFNFEETYKKEVVDYMVNEYEKGRTPNPDVMCNKYVKFGDFLNESKKRGADLIATGHYSRIQKTQKQTFELLKGIDKEKDQSYFLWTLGQNELSQTLFPIGNYEKSKVREMAQKFNLHTAPKKDSQGLCFLGEVSMKEFLERFLPNQKSGKVLNELGYEIGVHKGAIFYTIGQRKGFEIKKKTPQTPAYYVIAKDLSENTITVSKNPSFFVESNEAGRIEIRDTNWISGTPLKGFVYKARFRYRQELMNCEVLRVDKENRVAEFFLKDVNQPTPSGQSLVLYKENVCVGGGIIK